MPVVDATAQTGISKQQVSRWRDRLSDADGYRLALRKASQTGTDDSCRYEAAL